MSATNGTKARVLLVDDSPVTRRILEHALTTRGYAFLAAQDGLGGLASARAERPDIVLLDLDLPNLDGWAVARELKQDPKTRRIPIMALTAQAMPGDREKAIEAGCDDYAAKPVDVPDLERRMLALLAPNGDPRD